MIIQHVRLSSFLMPQRFAAGTLAFAVPNATLSQIHLLTTAEQQDLSDSLLDHLQEYLCARERPTP